MKNSKICYGRSYGEIDYDVAVLNVNSTPSTTSAYGANRHKNSSLSLKKYKVIWYET